MGLGRDAGTSTQVVFTRTRDGSQLSAISASVTGKMLGWSCGVGSVRRWSKQARMGE